MDVRNFTEELVSRRLTELLEKKPQVCRCDACLADMLALALDGLPARTYVRREGAIYRELEALADGFKLQVVERCLLAIAQVTKNPRHALAPGNPSGIRRKHEAAETELRDRKEVGLCRCPHGR